MGLSTPILISAFSFLIYGISGSNITNGIMGQEVTSQFDISDFFKLMKESTPLDLIVAMDRSKGIGPKYFYGDLKPFIRNLLQHYVDLTKDSSTKVSLLTFAKETTTVFENLPSRNISAKDEIFFNNTLWNSIRWTDIPHTDIQKTFTEAARILNTYQRTGAKRVFLVYTDGGFDVNKLPEIDSMRRNFIQSTNATIFVIGGGQWIKYDQISTIASRPEYYDNATVWKLIMDSTSPLFSSTRCPTNMCKNGGKCYGTSQNYECICQWGYSGADCSINDDECIYDVCENGATCEDMVNDFECHCADGFLEPFCKTKDTKSSVSPTGNAGSVLSTTLAPERVTRGQFFTTENIIIVSASAGGVLIIIIVSLVVCVTCIGKKKKVPTATLR